MARQVGVAVRGPAGGGPGKLLLPGLGSSLAISAYSRALAVAKVSIALGSARCQPSLATAFRAVWRAATD